MSGYSMGGYASYKLDPHPPRPLRPVDAPGRPADLRGPGRRRRPHRHGHRRPLRERRRHRAAGRQRHVDPVRARRRRGRRAGPVHERARAGAALRRRRAALPRRDLPGRRTTSSTPRRTGSPARSPRSAAPRPGSPTPAACTTAGTHLVDPRLGLGPTTIYWLSGLTSRVSGPGALATVDATDGARPEPGHTVTTSTSPLAPGDPTPGGGGRLHVDADRHHAARQQHPRAAADRRGRAERRHGPAPCCRTARPRSPPTVRPRSPSPGSPRERWCAAAGRRRRPGTYGTATVPVTGGSTVTW